MIKDVDLIINEFLSKNGRITSDDVARLADISRQAAHKRLSLLVKQNKLIRVGRTRGSYYVPFSSKKVMGFQLAAPSISVRLKNSGLQEDLVFDRLETTSSIFKSVAENSRKILRYAFTEMLNNAIEHSRSKYIYVKFYLVNNSIVFEVNDSGIGIYNNLISKFNLKDAFAAAQELLKGKRTTAPKQHSGEGIFFTSKIADRFVVAGSNLELIIDNVNDDLSIKDIPAKKGTKVVFHIGLHSKKDMAAMFGEYTNEDFEFSKTKVVVKLYERGVDYVSRSQARRILYGLDKFKTIILDFNRIKGIGQSFADEVFRIFKAEHPGIELVIKNADKSVLFMIKRAGGSGLQ